MMIWAGLFHERKLSEGEGASRIEITATGGGG